MAISFFPSLHDNGAPITGTDNDPNTTPPEAGRVYEAAGELGKAADPRTLWIYATFVGGTTPSFDGQVWIRDRAGAWVPFGSALTTVNGTPQVVPNIPANSEVFFQVTAINGAPTSGIPRLLAA
jgi:hypothetical protein